MYTFHENLSKYATVKNINLNLSQTSIYTNIFIPDFLYHLTNVFTNRSMNIDQLVFKLLEVTLVLGRNSLKFLLLRSQVPIAGQSMNNRNCV
jgi:hypothetical protein